MGARAKVVFVKAPGKRAVVDRAASGLIAVIQYGHRLGIGFCVGPPSDGLPFGIGAQLLALEIAQFIERAEILGCKARTSFEPDDFHPGFAEFGGEYSAHCSYTHNDDICSLGGHGLLRPSGRFGLSLQPCLRLYPGHGRACEDLFVLQIHRREIALSAGEAYQAPTRKVAVSTINRVREHAFHSVRPNDVEEFLRRGPTKAGCFTLFERRNDFVLLGSFELDERLFVSSAAIRIELSKPAPVEILQIGVRAGQGQVNVVEYARFVSSGFARRAGHEAFGEGGTDRRLIVIKERAMLNRGRMRLSGGGYLVFMLVERLGVDVRHEARARYGSCAYGCTHQK